MKKHHLVAVLNVLIAPAIFCAAKPSVVGRPIALQCDALNTPLGDDNATPRLSWKLQDSRPGAKQSAYRILVASKPTLLAGEHADVWDSGRIESDQSVDVVYAGPALMPETRYYWRVEVWDGNGKLYPASEVSWWETGLMRPSNWSAEWIGYEDREQAAVRAASADWVTNPPVEGYKGNGQTRHELRLNFRLAAPVKHATLYVTGEDTSAAWLNGQQVLDAQKQPAWGRTPWHTYRREEVTPRLLEGRNTLAIEITHYGGDGSITPMSVTLYVETAAGAIQTFKTGTPDWRANFQAPEGWQRTDFDDRAWPRPIPYPSPKDAFGNPASLGIPLPTASVAALRHGFELKKTVVSARLYATAMGAYTFNVNGRPVSDEVLAPGWTDFRQRVFYQAYDVTSLLHPGANALGALLAPGWYSTPLEWVGQGNNYGATPAALRAQLLVRYSDGSSQWIVTDSTWKADASPIVSAEIYNGETYDARLQQQGWDRPGFADASWHTADLIHPHEPAILWQSFQPIRPHQLLRPVSVKSPKPGVYIYDFGQNFAGVPRIALQGRKGETAQLRFGELLNADGTLYVENLRTAKATDRYTFAANGVMTYEPTFTYHGFRYMELTGATAVPGAVRAVVLYADAPQDAELTTGNVMINKLWSNILWGQRSNFLAAPTDCPQRDERLGWSADAQVFWRAASYNMDLTAYSRKYAGDLSGTLDDVGMFGIYAPGTNKINNGFGPGWSDAGVIVPWTSWIQTGDTTIIHQNWDAMSRYLDTILASNPDHLWSRNVGIPFGDWLAPEGPTSETLLATAYWAYDAMLMKQMAHAIGDAEQERKYSELFDNIRSAFQREFVHDDGVVGWQPTDSTHKGLQESQTGYVLALHMGLLPQSMRAQAADRLVQRIANNGGKLATGFLGTPYLLEDLSDTGHTDVSYSLLFNTQYPSWGYMVDHGATTMWERWNGDKMLGDPGMNSFNHYAYGAVAEWLDRYAAGVDTGPLAAGFHKVLLHPNFDAKLKNLDFHYNSRFGVIHSMWSSTVNGYRWTVTIPPNTTADVTLGHAAQSVQQLRNGSLAPVNLTCTTGATCTYTIQSGTYTFVVPSTDAKVPIS